MSLRTLQLLSPLFVSLAIAGSPFAQLSTADLYRIILNLTAEPATSMAVTWRTVEEVKQPVAQISEATDWTGFALHARTIDAKEELLMLANGTSVFHYSVVMGGLKPNTTYVYRVGGDSVWSEWNQFTTASNAPAPFEFVYFGDAQHGLKTFYPRIVREAFTKHPQASFWLFTGDVIDQPQRDSLWGEFFSASGFVHSIVPSVMVPGNHEYLKPDSGEAKERTLVGLWKPHVALPENGVKGLEETSYCFDYQGVRFIMLNGNDKLDEQAQWVDSLLAHNPNRWTIAALHQPLFSMGKQRDQRKTREAFMTVFDSHNVDLVLQGHDHVYARSARLQSGARVGDEEKGTVYVISQCGSDFYAVNPLHQHLMEKLGTRVQLYQVISIDGNTLSFKAYTATGLLFDSFELLK